MVQDAWFACHPRSRSQLGIALTRTKRTNWHKKPNSNIVFQSLVDLVETVWQLARIQRLSTSEITHRARFVHCSRVWFTLIVAIVYLLSLKSKFGSHPTALTVRIRSLLVFKWFRNRIIISSYLIARLQTHLHPRWSGQITMFLSFHLSVFVGQFGPISELMARRLVRFLLHKQTILQNVLLPSLRNKWKH